MCAKNGIRKQYVHVQLIVQYLVGNSGGCADGRHERVGHDQPERRLEGELRLETQRDFGVLGEVGAVDALQFTTKRINTF